MTAAEVPRPIVEVEDLVRDFDVSPPLVARLLAGLPRRILRAVDGVSLSIAPRRTLGLVGESGCGKSTLARCLAGLISPTAGTMRFEGEAIDLARRRDDRARQAIQMVFQDPYASLNPRWTVAETVGDPLRAFGHAASRRAMRDRVAALLRDVGLSASDAGRYPHEFSGGQRQRIAIARALASRPRFLICDEPTSALDVSVQATVLNLMRRVQAAHDLTYLFISHNLAVIDHMADDVGVMYLGRIVERQPKHRLFEAPSHPYTRLLLETVPSLETIGRTTRALGGEVPSPLDPPAGCAFHPRCPHANDRCRRERPGPTPLPEGGSVLCHAVEENRI